MYHSRVCIGAYVCIITAARGAEERRLGICGPPSQSLTQAGLPDRAERISTKKTKSVPSAYPSPAGLPDGAERISTKTSKSVPSVFPPLLRGLHDKIGYGQGSPPLGRGPGNKRFEPKWLHQFGHRISLTPAGETDLLPGGGLNTLVNNHTTAFCYSTHAKLTHLAKPTPPP